MFFTYSIILSLFLKTLCFTSTLLFYLGAPPSCAANGLMIFMNGRLRKSIYYSGIFILLRGTGITHLPSLQSRSQKITKKWNDKISAFPANPSRKWVCLLFMKADSATAIKNDSNARGCFTRISIS